MYNGTHLSKFDIKISTVSDTYLLLLTFENEKGTTIQDPESAHRRRLAFSKKLTSDVNFGLCQLCKTFNSRSPLASDNSHFFLLKQKQNFFGPGQK